MVELMLSSALQDRRRPLQSLQGVVWTDSSFNKQAK